MPPTRKVPLPTSVNANYITSHWCSKGLASFDYRPCQGDSRCLLSHMWTVCRRFSIYYSGCGWYVDGITIPRVGSV